MLYNRLLTEITPHNDIVEATSGAVWKERTPVWKTQHTRTLWTEKTEPKEKLVLVDLREQWCLKIIHCYKLHPDCLTLKRGTLSRYTALFSCIYSESSMQLFFSFISKLLSTWSASGWHQTNGEEERESKRQREPDACCSTLCQLLACSLQSQHTCACTNKYTLQIHTSHVVPTLAYSEHHVSSNNHEKNGTENILLQQETDRQTDRDGRGGWGQDREAQLWR